MAETTDASNSSNALADAADALLQLPHNAQKTSNNVAANYSNGSRGKNKATGAPTSRLPPEPTAGKRAPDEPLAAHARGDGGGADALAKSTAKSPFSKGCAPELDEFMFGWRPKTSATGGLPNITNEPRKPVDLGTMARNGAECKSGIMAHQDIVVDLTNQRQKKYLVGDDRKSHMPRGEDMYAHTAECLRQAEGAKLERGGWMGGDAWFGYPAPKP